MICITDRGQKMDRGLFSISDHNIITGYSLVSICKFGTWWRGVPSLIRCGHYSMAYLMIIVTDSGYYPSGPG